MAEGFEEKMASLGKIAYDQALVELKAGMLNEEADFKLADLERNEVALTDLKGRTVNLNF